MLRILGLILLSISMPLFASQPSSKEVARLIACLGDKDFATRSKAYQQLSRMGPAIIPLLKDAVLQSKDLEIRRYARALLQKARHLDRVTKGMKAQTVLLKPGRRLLSTILDELKKKTGIRYLIRSNAHDVAISPPMKALPVLELLENLAVKSGNELDMEHDLFDPFIILQKASVPRRALSIYGAVGSQVDLEYESPEEEKRGPALILKPRWILDPSRHYSTPSSEDNEESLELLEAITDNRERLTMLESDHRSLIMSAPRQKATKLSILKVKTTQELYGDRKVIEIPDFQASISKAHEHLGVKIVPIDVSRLRRRRYVVSFYMEITGNRAVRGPFFQVYDEWGDAMSIDEERIVPKDKGVKVDLFTDRRRGSSPESMTVVFFGFSVKQSRVLHLRDVPLPPP